MGLTVKAASVRYGSRTALDRVSLAFEPGVFVGLVGPNGAGKTTLLRLAAGLVPPAEGCVRLDGRAIDGIARDERARCIAVLFQGASVGWPMRVSEVVALGRLPHRRAFAPESAADREAVARAMTRADITALADRTEPTLSSGERMRVLLARALAVESAWLLADEPITALDPGHQLDAMAMLRRTARDGIGVIAVLHDLTLAARFCDRLVVLDDGHVAADGRPGSALDDALLRSVFGVTAARGTHDDGTGYVLPWTRAGSTEREDGA